MSLLGTPAVEQKLTHEEYMNKRRMDVIEEMMRVPHSPTAQFELPNGYLTVSGKLLRHVTLHEITGYEEDMLGSELMKSFDKTNQLMSSCLRRLTNEDATEVIEDPRKMVSLPYELTSTDRVFLIFAIRRVSVGDVFPFVTTCPYCEKEDIFACNIATEMQVMPMKDPLNHVYRGETPYGTKFEWRVLNGSLERELSEIKDVDRQKHSVTYGMFIRLLSLNGSKPRLADLKELGLSDRGYIKDEFTEIEGGIDTSVSVDCGFCSKNFRYPVNPQSSGFFFPHRVLRDWKKKYSL